MLELQEYFLQTLKFQYKTILDLFIYMQDNVGNIPNLRTLENFIRSFHEKEVRDGHIRQTLYDMIYNIDDHSNDDDSPIHYRIVLDNKTNSHRTIKSKTFDCIVHCRCGSVFEEISLVQCYACQVCIIIIIINIDLFHFLSLVLLFFH